MITDAAYTVLFYLIAAAAVLLALAVVNARRLLRAAVYLMGVLAMTAGLYVMLGAAFLAGIQVLVYVGGIVVLIVFAVMLTRSAELRIDNPSLLRKVLGAIASISFLVMTALVFWSSQFPAAAGVPVTGDDTLAIGRQLLNYGPTGYVLPFEIISLLLLASVIGGIVVARKTPPRGQPFTPGGDRPDEVTVQMPRRQRDAGRGGGQ